MGSSPQKVKEWGQVSLSAHPRYFTDLIGRQTSVTDATNLSTQFGYDKHSLLTKIIDAKNQETILSYDANGNLSSVRDARSGLTQYGYDTKNRPQGRTDPLLKTETFIYDKMNNLIRRIDRKNQVTASDQPADIYPLNRVKHVRFRDAATTDCTYDAGNRLRQIVVPRE